MISSIRTGRRLVRPRLRWLGVLVAALAAIALGSPLAAGAATRLYPDLQIFGPTSLTFDDRVMEDGEVHQLVRFDAFYANMGEGALELQLVPQTSGIGDFIQRIYESDPPGFHDERLGALPLNVAPFDVPYGARFEIWSERSFNRAQARNFTRGTPLFVNPNFAFCMRDDVPVDPDASLQGTLGVGTYQCTAAMQGISAGWTVVQSWFHIGHWVDLGTTPLPDGQYVLRVLVDPENQLFESEGKADTSREGQVPNSGVAYFQVIGGRIAGTG